MSDPENIPTSKEPFEHWETHVAGRLGLSRDQIRTARQDALVEGQDWKLEKNRVVLSERGLIKLYQWLREPGSPPGGHPIPPEQENGAPGATTEAPAPSELIILKVWQANLPNYRIILAHRPDQDPNRRENLLRVRVVHSQNFVRGMELPARHLEADYYECARSMPRWRGKW